MAFLFVAAITAIGVLAIESDARERSRAEVQDYAQAIATRLERHGNSFSAYLRAGAALFSSLEEVRPQAFRQFVAELRIDQNYQGVEGIGWVSVVRREDSEAFLARTRATQPDFPSIRPPLHNEREQIAPVTFLAPDTSRNRRALGFDMLSEPARAAAMEEASRMVEPTASGRVDLTQEASGRASGFLIFMPVFRSGSAGNEQSSELAGYVFSAFNAGQFLDAALEREASGQLGARLYDGVADTEHLLVSRSVGQSNSNQLTKTVTIANRDFLLVIDSGESQHMAPLSTLTLVSGLALASLLMLVLRLLARQAREDEARLAFLEEQQSIRNSLSRELNHRVKNTLANVLSILSLTRRRATDLDDFADSLEGRVRALSATHDLLTGSDWGTTPIGAVIEAELQHVAHADEHNLTVKGPPVELAPNDALSFGLAIHELATNAAKYGALSVPSGRISVCWHLEGDNLAMVEWLERGGPEVSPAKQRGFGLDLIEKIVAHELRHAVNLDFLPEGVRCVIGVPVRRRSEFQMREGASNPGQTGS